MDLHGVACAKWSAWTAAAGEQLAAANTSPDDPAFMLYTSGSGGTPKAAVHPHGDILVTRRNYPQKIFCLRAAPLTFSLSKFFFSYALSHPIVSPPSVCPTTPLNPQRTYLPPR